MANWWDTTFGGNSSSGFGSTINSSSSYQDFLNSTGYGDSAANQQLYADTMDGINTSSAFGDTQAQTQPQTSLMSDIGTGVQALSGITNAYTGYKNLQLAEDAQDLAESSFANEVTAYNTALQNASDVGAALGTHLTDEEVAAKDAETKANYVSE